MSVLFDQLNVKNTFQGLSLDNFLINGNFLKITK